MPKSKNPQMTKHKKHIAKDIRYMGRKFTPYQQINGYQSLCTGIRQGIQLTGIFKGDAPILPVLENQTYFIEFHGPKLIARVYTDSGATMQGYILE